MSRIESIGMTRSQGRPASLNEARRALVNPDLRSVVLGSHADRLDLRERIAMASDAHACLDEAAKASLAGRLFVVDHATLVDDLNPIANAMTGRIVRPPFETTPIFIPGFEGGSCPLFIIKRHARGVVDLLTALPLRNNEKFYWGVSGFAAGYEDLVGAYTIALLAAIDARHLKPIGPPR
jgi:hypothetical protein